jgi:DNA-directed RNA polymerase subunit RPC12/RpoP
MSEGKEYDLIECGNKLNDVINLLVETDKRVAELEVIEQKAIEQSEYIQSHGLTEFEVAGLRSRIAELEAQLAQMREAENATCLWKENLDGPWETACGMSWEFIEDGPEENKCIYCHHCGKKIMVERQEIESEEE